MTARPSSDVGGAAPADSEWTRWTTGMHLLVTDPTVLSRARAIVDAELDAVEKNRLSHRGQALTRLVEQLERRFSARR